MGVLLPHREHSHMCSGHPLSKSRQVLGLVILRVKEPMLERPYKTWIITPLIFCAVRKATDLLNHLGLTGLSLWAGVSILALHAHHCCAARGYGGPRYVAPPPF